MIHVTIGTSQPQLTPYGRQLLQERLHDLRSQRLPLLQAMLVEPDRDERMVAEFGRVLAQADELQDLLACAEDLRPDPAAQDGRIRIGMRVQVLLERDVVWVRPVHPAEAFLDDERISSQSPLAVALMGARAGRTVLVQAPSGPCPCEVLRVEAGP